MNNILIVGAGGHAKVVADILLSQGMAVGGFLDDDSATWGLNRLNMMVLGGIEMYTHYDLVGLIMGVGSNPARQRIVERLGREAQRLWVNAIHPRATVASSVRMGHGVVIAGGAVVNPDSVLGNHTIINTSASVDHDCFIGNYAHLGPGTHLSGGVRVGEGALLGVGVSIAPGCSVGAWAVVGAGAVVVRDIPDHVTAKGVPARWTTK